MVLAFKLKSARALLRVDVHNSEEQKEITMAGDKSIVQPAEGDGAGDLSKRVHQENQNQKLGERVVAKEVPSATLGAAAMVSIADKLTNPATRQLFAESATNPGMGLDLPKHYQDAIAKYEAMIKFALDKTTTV
jgi:hypothetical protein